MINVVALSRRGDYAAEISSLQENDADEWLSTTKINDRDAPLSPDPRCSKLAGANEAQDRRFADLHQGRRFPRAHNFDSSHWCHRVTWYSNSIRVIGSLMAMSSWDARKNVANCWPFSSGKPWDFLSRFSHIRR
jgi:hypothetical protein